MTTKRPYTILMLCYSMLSVALLLYSYTQVDLNLTLSRASIVQTVEKAFQYVGYYNRPLSTVLYGGIIIGFFIAYLALLKAVQRKELSTRKVWRIIGVVSGILVFSYPAAVSYDFFNYLFTAKTVVLYHQNPYLVTPLQFAGIDPWTNFMRWTHLSTAYTPLWIALSIVPFLLGMGYFITVLFATKAMVAGFYLLACYAIARVLSITNPKEETYGLALFALQPLILVESLVSGHNDIVLAAFVLLSLWFYLRKERVSAWLYLALSIAAKLMTIALIPVYLAKKNIRWMLIAMTAALALVLTRREFLPWYWVWMMPFIALSLQERKIVRASTILTVFLLASYAPYLYYGSYSAVEQTVKTMLVWIGVGAGVLSLFLPVSMPKQSDHDEPLNK